MAVSKRCRVAESRGHTGIVGICVAIVPIVRAGARAIVCAALLAVAVVVVIVPSVGALRRHPGR